MKMKERLTDWVASRAKHVFPQEHAPTRAPNEGTNIKPTTCMVDDKLIVRTKLP